MRFRKADRAAGAAAEGYACGNGLQYAQDNRHGVLPSAQTALPGLAGSHWADLMTGRVGVAGRDELMAVSATWYSHDKSRRAVTVLGLPDRLPPVQVSPVADPCRPLGPPLVLPADLAGLFRAYGHPDASRLLTGPVLSLMRARPDLGWASDGDLLTVWDDGTRPVTDLPARLALARAVLLVALPGAFRERG